MQAKLFNHPKQALSGMVGIGLGIVWVAHCASAAVDFGREIQPILAKRCFECHDGREATSGLRLDVRADAMRGGDTGENVIVAGDSSASTLVQRISSGDPEFRMPPKGEPLTESEIRRVQRWIDAGANWPDEYAGSPNLAALHWAFRAPTRPPLPDVSRIDWIQNPIDAFVLARLESTSLEPSVRAEKTTLIRRLSLDLIGLPPTIAEVDNFLGNSSEDAYRQLVERLLESPHYGERWGRHWLDAARYADSDGYEKDKSREVWFYRDWVINALNRDLPYDEFIIQQLAGDLLPNANQDTIVATGFLRNSMINEEGGVDPEQFRMEAMFDRMDAIGKSILGITIQCGQCHDHKYDPLTQQEYYEMFAFLNNDHEANIAVYTPEEQKQRVELLERIRDIESRLREDHPQWQDRLARWEDRLLTDAKPTSESMIDKRWIVVRPSVDEISTGGQKYLPIEDGSFLALGYAPTKHRVKMEVQTELRAISAVRLELLNDPNLPLGGPGRSILGTGALTEFEVEAAPADAPSERRKLKIAQAEADVSLPVRPLRSIFDDKSGRKRVTGPISLAIDGREETAWGIDQGPGRRNQPRTAVFNLEEPLQNPGGMVLTFYLSQKHGGWNSDDNQNNNLGRFRLSISSSPYTDVDTLPKPIKRILETPRSKRSRSQNARLFSYWRTTVPEWKEANDRIERLWKQHPAGSSQLVLMARDRQRMTSVLERGDFLRPIRPVQPGTPEFLHSLPEDAPPNRLTFAHWLVDRRSPTTARAIVNRIWQSYFGTGLVSTSEDLGVQSEAPSHPKLLDWLAVEFMDQGWSLKRLHRLIVTSATYQQSSVIDRRLLKRDPFNRLLARGPRMRVEAETVRDIGLKASGLLNPRIGGPSVFPPLPAFMLKPPVSYGPKVWNEATGPDRYRRGIYSFRYRSLPYPVFQTFDAANGEASCVRRSVSNTPLQALVTLNEPISMESARALARNTLKNGGESDLERVTYAFRRCVSRHPSGAESKELVALLRAQLERFADGSVDIWPLITMFDGKRPRIPAGESPQQLAAWTVVSRVLLNLDETITKQ